jgi:hypothetical protein
VLGRVFFIKHLVGLVSLNRLKKRVPVVSEAGSVRWKKAGANKGTITFAFESNNRFNETEFWTDHICLLVPVSGHVVLRILTNSV